MKPDYTKTCWHCGKAEMKPKGSYCQCSACGATWNEVPKLAASCVTEETDIYPTLNGIVRDTRNRPVVARLKTKKALS